MDSEVHEPEPDPNMQEIKLWTHKLDKIGKATIWIYVIEFSTLLIASLAAGIIVIFVRKRKDKFFISTLACYVVSSIIYTAYSVYYLIIGSNDN